MQGSRNEVRDRAAGALRSMLFILITSSPFHKEEPPHSKSYQRLLARLV